MRPILHCFGQSYLIFSNENASKSCASYLENDEIWSLRKMPWGAIRQRKFVALWMQTEETGFVIKSCAPLAFTSLSPHFHSVFLSYSCSASSQKLTPSNGAGTKIVKQGKQTALCPRHKPYYYFWQGQS